VSLKNRCKANLHLWYREELTKCGKGYAVRYHKVKLRPPLATDFCKKCGITRTKAETLKNKKPHNNKNNNKSKVKKVSVLNA